jgi:hypothetical protein
VALRVNLDQSPILAIARLVNADPPAKAFADEVGAEPVTENFPQPLNIDSAWIIVSYSIFAVSRWFKTSRSPGYLTMFCSASVSLLIGTEQTICIAVNP